jgi:hypothetical protein
MSNTSAPADYRAVNNAFVDKITSSDGGLYKKASDSLNEFLRVQMREEGFLREIQPLQPFTNDDLDRQVDTDKPVKVFDKEPGSPAAYTVPFASTPSVRYMRAPRFRLMFGRIMTPKFVKDADELRSYSMDVRQVFSDNALKDLMAEEDKKYTQTCDAICGGAAGATVTETGGIHWQTLAGGLNRNNLQEALKIGPGLRNRIEVKTILVNNLTIKDIEKWQRLEVGGDLSMEMLVNGFGKRKFGGRDWIVSIKQDLVPTNTIRMFSEAKYLGKGGELSPVQMYVKKEAFMLEFFAYETIGVTIGNPAAVTRADFGSAYNPS